MVDTAVPSVYAQQETADSSSSSETQHPLQHSSSDHRLSPSVARKSASHPGWKAFAASTEDVQDPLTSPATVTGSPPSHTYKIAPSLPYNDSYDTSVDNESHLGRPSLGTIDETTAAGFSTHDRAFAGPSSAASNGVRTQGRERTDSSDYEDNLYSPSTYPPVSEDTTEAQRVQQNLERWGAEEKMRRKAHRTSKLAAARAPPVTGSYRAPSRGFHESSNGLGSGPSSELLTEGPSASPGGATYSPDLRKRTDIMDRRGSDGSTTGLGRHTLQRPSSISSAESAHSLNSYGSDERPNRKLPPIGTRVAARTSNGAPLSGVREEPPISPPRNPFVDPTDTNDSTYSSYKSRTSLKPTPTAARPIVTVGRASSIQRQALESGYKGKGKGKARSMPTIVATDTEPIEEIRGLRIRSGDPFMDDTSFDKPSSTTLHQGGLDEEVAMDLEGRRKRTLTGDLGESDLTDGITPTPSRHSTNSSKFRELGMIEGEDDWTHHTTNTSKRKDNHNPVASDESVEHHKKPWWSDWLCGCGTSFDDDEQAGRTNPME